MLEIKYLDNPHSYYINGEEVPSVSKILGHSGGGRKSLDGHEFHEYMHNFAVSGDKKHLKEIIAIDNARPLEERIGAEGMINNLSTLLQKEKLQFITSEFVVANKLNYNNQNYWYAGTLDLLCARLNKDCLELFIIDYKTGAARNDDHYKQLELYANGLKFLYDMVYPLLIEHLIAKGFTNDATAFPSLSTVHGVVIYNDSFHVKDFSCVNYNTQELTLAYYGALKEKVWHGGKVYKQQSFLKEAVAEVAELMEQHNTLEETIAELKEKLEKHLDSEGYKHDKLLIYKTKGRTSCNLKKDIKERLLKEHREYFEIKQGEPSFSWKLL